MTAQFNRLGRIAPLQKPPFETLTSGDVRETFRHGAL